MLWRGGSGHFGKGPRIPDPALPRFRRGEVAPGPPGMVGQRSNLRVFRDSDELFTRWMVDPLRSDEMFGIHLNIHLNCLLKMVPDFVIQMN